MLADARETPDFDQSQRRDDARSPLPPVGPRKSSRATLVSSRATLVSTAREALDLPSLKSWVPDDTIEHEAWNDSDKLRVVLSFDIWRPHLTPPDRALVTALSAGVEAFPGGSIGPES